MKLFGAVLVLGLTGLSIVASTGCEASASAEGTSSGGGDGGASSSGEPFTPPPPGLSEADAQKVCEAIRTPYCNRLELCSPNSMKVFFGDLQTCLLRNITECKLAMTLPGITVTLAQGEACGAAYTGRACDALDAIPACVLPGVVVNGGPCLSDSQCKSANCGGGTTAACGTCEPYPVQGTAAIGAVCAKSDDCVAWATCKDGKCAEAGRAKGQPCTDNDACIESKGLGCDGFGVCQKITAVAEAAQPCPSDDVNHTTTGCKDGLCNERVTPEACIARVPEGGDCSGETTFCASPYRCDEAKKCTLPRLDYDTTCNVKR